MDTSQIYQTMIKPSWSPPGRLFGPVRTVLYLMIIISYGHVVIQVIQKKLPRTILIPFVINIIANALFTYLRFKKSNLLLGLIDIIIVLITIIITIIVIRPHYKRVAYMQIPYLLRVCFATVLATSIFIMNK
ncbi:tryptophan-rich sensory protein [Candidatus Gracilibacteria bacterium]|nr:tryptophan-rich sensory protein [Candidatus Gracilibacteria bacterium]